MNLNKSTFLADIQGSISHFQRRIERLNKNPFRDMLRFLPRDQAKVIIDGGAYHGKVAGKFLRTFRKASVYAFEPQRESFQILQENAKRNPRLHPIHSAISSSTGEKTFFVSQAPYMSALSPGSTLGLRSYPNQMTMIDKRQVSTITLDEWAARENLTGVEIIKLDLQGHETEALKGAHGLLKTSVQLIFTEVEFGPIYDKNSFFSDVEKLLKDYGFKLFQLYDLYTTLEGQLVAGDALFVRRPA